MCTDDLECAGFIDACPAETVCEEGACRPIEAGECFRAGADCGERICRGNDVIRPACDANLFCLNTVLSCQGGEVCLGGRCLPEPECEQPGAPCAEPVCEGPGVTEFVCSDERVCEPRPSACPDGAVCEAGVCREVAPEECVLVGDDCGERVCRGDDAIRPVCDEDLVCRDTIVSCQDEEICRDGRCVPAPQCDVPGDVCAPAACDGNTVVRQVCSADRQCAEERADCGEEVCDGGACREAVPGDCVRAGAPCGPVFCQGTDVARPVCNAQLQCQNTIISCQGDEICIDGRCDLPPQCDAPGTLCEPSRCEGDTLVGLVCTDDLQCVEDRSDCFETESCIDGRCVPDEPVGCPEPGVPCFERFCLGARLVQSVCDEDNLCQLLPNLCPEGETCAGGECVPLVPGVCFAPRAECDAPRCAGNDAVRSVCDANLECQAEIVSCQAEEVCVDGECVLEPCEVGEACAPPVCRGDEAVRSVCSPDRQCAEEIEVCGPERDCVDGRCVAPECAAPGEACAPAACDGAAVVRTVCSADRLCVEQREACPNGQLCDGGACRDVRPGECAAEGAPCGVALCLGNNVVRPTCDARLRCQNAIESCEAGSICLAAACVPEPECDVPGRECEPAACDGNAVVRQICSPDRQCVAERSPCPELEICDDGQCVEPPGCAAPGDACGPVVCDGNSVVQRVCSADLECVDQAQPCPLGELCDAGACRAPGPGECVITDAPCGDPVCRGGAVVQPTCSFDGECQDRVTECAEGEVCVNGACADAAGGCACSTPGATVGPAPAGCELEDANACSGWQSVIIGSEGGGFSPEEEAEALNRVVPDGTTVCAFGCCMQISCP